MREWKLFQYLALSLVSGKWVGSQFTNDNSISECIVLKWQVCLKSESLYIIMCSAPIDPCPRCLLGLTAHCGH